MPRSINTRTNRATGIMIIQDRLAARSLIADVITTPDYTGAITRLTGEQIDAIVIDCGQMIDVSTLLETNLGRRLGADAVAAILAAFTLEQAHAIRYTMPLESADAFNAGVNKGVRKLFGKKTELNFEHVIGRIRRYGPARAYGPWSVDGVTTTQRFIAAVLGLSFGTKWLKANFKANKVMPDVVFGFDVYKSSTVAKSGIETMDTIPGLTPIGSYAFGFNTRTRQMTLLGDRPKASMVDNPTSVPPAFVTVDHDKAVMEIMAQMLRQGYVSTVNLLKDLKGSFEVNDEVLASWLDNDLLSISQLAIAVAVTNGNIEDAKEIQQNWADYVAGYNKLRSSLAKNCSKGYRHSTAASARSNGLVHDVTTPAFTGRATTPVATRELATVGASSDSFQPFSGSKY